MPSPLTLLERDQLALIRDVRTSVEVLSILGRSRYEKVRAVLAASERTPGLVLDVLALDTSKRVRAEATSRSRRNWEVDMAARFAAPAHEREQERPGA